MGHFWPPGSGSGSRDPIEYGSYPELDPQNLEAGGQLVCSLLLCKVLYMQVSEMSLDKKKKPATPQKWEV